MEWPADRIERRPITSLVAYARNARQHSADQVQQLKASMVEFGWTIPVLVDERDVLIAGHGRLMAAAELVAAGRQEFADAPTMVARGWSKAQIQAYRLADNRLALSAEWSDDMLRLELQDLRDEEYDLALTGFDDDELKDLYEVSEDDDHTGEDDAPAPQAKAVSRVGDIWIMGDHRLVVGDSTDPAVMQALFGDELADVLFTSPPYAQQRQYDSGQETDWLKMMRGVFAAAPVHDRAQILVNLGLVHADGEWSPYWDDWIAWMRGEGWRRFGWYIWDQGPGLPGDWNGRLAPSHEFVFHFNRVSERPNKTKACSHAGERLGGQGLRSADGTLHAKTHAGRPIQNRKIPDSVIRVMRHKGGLGDAGSHPAPFPVALCVEMLEAFSDAGDIAYEPFCGSGTQLVAAERLGRMCRASELSPIYADVAVRRWQREASRRALLQGGKGFSFDDAQEARASE